MKKSANYYKRILAMICVVLLACTQVVFLWPQTSYGAAGETLEVRVQYFGERGDKLRTKATFTKAELEAMGAATYCYSNVTDVGTVMVMKAYGPKVSTIIDQAGIDIGSVKRVTFRTTDGYTRDFTGAQITAYRKYYPKLNLYSKVKVEPEDEDSDDPDKPDKPDPTKPDTPDPTKPDTPDPTKPAKPDPTDTPDPSEPTNPGDSEDKNQKDTSWNLLERLGVISYAADKYEIILNYIRNDDGRSLTPREGSLSGASSVPAILALQFGHTKAPGKKAENLTMSSSQTFRFCLGQSTLQEGKSTAIGYGGGDVTSMDSAHSIYGMDVILYGSPVKGVNLSLDKKNLKVGSKARIKAKILGDEAYKEYLDVGSLTWESSDESIATVDENGVVTILKEGEVTITATAKDGTSGSITIGGPQGAAAGTDSDVSNKDKQSPEAKGDKKTKDAAKGILVREITIGDEVIENPAQLAQTKAEDNTQALDEGEDYSGKTAAGSAAVAIASCAAGAIIRIRRFKLSI